MEEGHIMFNITELLVGVIDQIVAARRHRVAYTPLRVAAPITFCSPVLTRWTNPHRLLPAPPHSGSTTPTPDSDPIMLSPSDDHAQRPSGIPHSLGSFAVPF